MSTRTLDYVSVQSDVNCTLTFADSTKTINPIISEIAGIAIFKWERELPAMSYKDWVQKVLFPGNKYDPKIKEKQEDMLERFFNVFKEKAVTANEMTEYDKYWSLYQNLAGKYEDPDTKKVRFSVFPSFIRMLDSLKKVCSCTLTTRTFGPDGPAIREEFEKKEFLFSCSADFHREGMHISELQDTLSGDVLYETLLKVNILGQDQFKEWAESGYQAIHGKKMYCVADGIFQERNVLTIALDDNLDDSSDPHARNIAAPVDIYGRTATWQSPGIIGIKVDTIRAALEDNYFVDELNEELLKRGYEALTE
jgi:hypothetical protein